jgi:hypothetical protein
MVTGEGSGTAAASVHVSYHSAYEQACKHCCVQLSTSLEGIWRSESTAPLTLINHVTIGRWVLSFTPQILYSWGNCPLNSRLAWTWLEENLSPLPGIVLQTNKCKHTTVGLYIF